VAKKFRYSKSNSLTYRDLNLTGRRKGHLRTCPRGGTPQALCASFA
jgi:hypothetical protein